jgi:hypothetical protein
MTIWDAIKEAMAPSPLREPSYLPEENTQLTPKNANLCLYVIGFEDEHFRGIVKIGVTNNIKKRLATLQTGCPWRLEVKGMVYRPDSFKYEDWLHSHFDRQRIRADGEWFDFGKNSDPLEIVSGARY